MKALLFVLAATAATFAHSADIKLPAWGLLAPDQTLVPVAGEILEITPTPAKGTYQVVYRPMECRPVGTYAAGCTYEYLNSGGGLRGASTNGLLCESQPAEEYSMVTGVRVFRSADDFKQAFKNRLARTATFGGAEVRKSIDHVSKPECAEVVTK